LPIPGATGIEVDKFQYNAGINIDQKLFDGGLYMVQKNIKQIEGDIKNLETETGLYKLNELVNNYFFGIITMQKSIEILNLRTATLEERKKSVASGVRNGMVLQTELDRLDAEILTTNQQISEIKIAQKQMDDNLKVMAGIDPRTHINWKLPAMITINDSISRVELKLYERNREYSDALANLQNHRYLPHVSAFGQAGYSYPSLNMFDNGAATYYIVGAKLSWQIFDWNQAKKEKQLLELQKDRININEADFNRNLQMSINSEIEELDKVQQLIDDDQKIIKAKEAISKASASALDNGSITTADYLNDLNSELRSRFDYENHKIAMLQSSARLAVLKGINIE
jgi:outer membrane protein TolC